MATEIERLIVRLIGDGKDYIAKLVNAKVQTDKWVQDVNGKWREHGRFVGGVYKTISEMEKKAGLSKREYSAKANAAYRSIQIGILDLQNTTAGATTAIAGMSTSFVVSQERMRFALRMLGTEAKGYAAAMTQAARATGELVTQAARFVSLRLAGRGGAAFLGIGAALIGGREFGKLDLEMAKMKTLVGLTTNEINTVRQAVQQISQDAHRPISEVAEAAYFAAGAFGGLGPTGKEAIEVLEVSAKAATAGLGETKDTVDAVTSALNAYGRTGLTATKAVNTIIGAVRAGKMEATEFAPALGRVLPIASALGIKFTDVAGTMAVFSRTGSDASEAATSLIGLMNTLLGTSKAGEEALASVGLELSDLREVAQGPMGLLSVMRLMDEAFKGQIDTLREIFPNIRAFRGVADVLAQDIGAVNKVMNEAAANVDYLNEAFENVDNTISGQFIKTWNTLKASLTETAGVVGNLVGPLLPVLNTLIKSFTLGMKVLLVVILSIIEKLQRLPIIGGLLKKAVGATGEWSAGYERVNKELDGMIERLQKAIGLQATGTRNDPEATRGDDTSGPSIPKVQKQIEGALEILKAKKQGYQDVDKLIQGMKNDVAFFGYENNVWRQLEEIIQETGIERDQDKYNEIAQLEHQLKLLKERQEAEEEYQRLVKDAASRARDMLVSGMTEAEKMARQVEEIRQLMRIGALTGNEGSRLIKNLMEQALQEGGEVPLSAGKADVFGGGTGRRAEDVRTIGSTRVRTEKGIWKIVDNTVNIVPRLDEIKTGIDQVNANKPLTIEDLTLP